MFITVVANLILAGSSLLMAANPDFLVSTNILQIEPFTITETTYVGESAISEEKCQQKVKLIDDVRCKAPSTGNGYKPDPEAIKRCKLMKPQEGLSCKCKVQITYPQFASEEYDKGVLDKINLELRNRAEKFKNKYASTLIDCFPSLTPSDYRLTYEFEFRGKYGGEYQLYQNNKVLTVQYSSSIATGAHPVYANNFLNFAFNSGKLLTFEEVINKAALASVYDDIWISLTRDPKSYFFDDKAESYSQAKAQNKAIFKIDNFYFSERGLIVYFNPYDVGPWSSGEFVFQIRRDHINKKFL